MKYGIAIAVVLLCVIGSGCRAPKHELVRWPDGTNDAFAIEVERGRGHLVLIPDVRFIQKNDRFISGKAYWRYMDGFYPTNALYNTNEFWFVVDKKRTLAKGCLFISNEYQSWASWCVGKGAPTNLQEVTMFKESASPYSGGEPQL